MQEAASSLNEEMNALVVSTHNHPLESKYENTHLFLMGLLYTKRAVNAPLPLPFPMSSVTY